MDSWLDVYKFLVRQIEDANCRADYWEREEKTMRAQNEQLKKLLKEAGIAFEPTAMDGGEGI